ncbi:hypothetical protein [Streptomyces aidingensis]|uniref:Uncharacterized protein n=1 Tax=Streptomyces aidingensis TaxID=910347 RepID=A0A1I1TSD3_9ACTN|nr:hypothetical protein [Streptomyces aidingensis]SFD61492.1 hypothetical protein SAMN05421773_1217 [Streptomyces aidingensis]
MTLHQPASCGAPSWLSVGVQAHDNEADRAGTVLLVRDGSGGVRTGDIPSPARVLLRPAGQGAAWWADAAGLEPTAGGEQ